MEDNANVFDSFLKRDQITSHTENNNPTQRRYPPERDNLRLNIYALQHRYTFLPLPSVPLANDYFVRDTLTERECRVNAVLLPKLVNYIDTLEEDLNSMIIYCENNGQIQAVNQFLQENMFPSDTLYEDVPEEEMKGQMNRFSQYKFRYLVTTSKAFPQSIRYRQLGHVSHLVNYDYTHTDTTNIDSIINMVDDYVQCVGWIGRSSSRNIILNLMVTSNEDDDIIRQRFQQFQNTLISTYCSSVVFNEHII